MKYSIITEGFRRTADMLSGAGERIHQAIGRAVAVRREEAVTFIKRRYRSSTVTTESRTAIRTSKLVDAYDSNQEAVARGWELNVGLIRPGLDALTLLYGRVHEGFDASGSPVTEFIIRPRKARHLVFQLPPEKGGGWVTTDRVVLRPRPTLPRVRERLPEVLSKDLDQIAIEAFGA